MISARIMTNRFLTLCILLLSLLSASVAVAEGTEPDVSAVLAMCDAISFRFREDILKHTKYPENTATGLFVRRRQRLRRKERWELLWLLPRMR